MSIAGKKTKTAALFTGLALVAAACGASTSEVAEAPTTEAQPAPAAETEEVETEDVAVELGDPVNLSLTFDGLETLGDTHNYEAWVVVDGSPVTAGIFDIDEDGKAIGVDGEAAEYVSYEGATDVVISIEPEVDDDPAPAATKVLGGAIDDAGNVELTIDHPAALGTDFSEASGTFVIATPTTESTDDENSGVWFLSKPGPEASLEIPELPEGWLYEGWAVVDGTPISTGTFSSAEGADNFGDFSGDLDAPAYPGEDFIVNAPDGFDFPLDLTGATIVISVEPDTDNSPAPFALKPLVGEAPSAMGGDAGPNFPLSTNAGGITGSGSVG